MHSVRVLAMAHSRSVLPLLRRGVQPDFVWRSATQRGRLLASLSVHSVDHTLESRSASEGPGWRASAGAAGVAALAGFISLLQLHHEPVTSRSEGVQETEALPATEALVWRYVEIWFQLMFFIRFVLCIRKFGYSCRFCRGELIGFGKQCRNDRLVAIQYQEGEIDCNGIFCGALMSRFCK